MPTVLKVLRGNPGQRPLNHDEPQPGELSVEYPEELGTNEVARVEWDRTIVPAIEIGQITQADRQLAIAHCELVAARRSQLIEGAIPGANVVTAGAKGYPMPNPAIKMAEKTLMLLIKVDSELGLSPSSRSRVKVKNRGKHGPVDERRKAFFSQERG